jgi:hypothetical protein
MIMVIAPHRATKTAAATARGVVTKERDGEPDQGIDPGAGTPAQ